MATLKQKTAIKRDLRKSASPVGVASNISMTKVAYEAILTQIMDGNLRATKPMSEGQLALTIGLSRTPVREALGRLEGEVLVQRTGRTLAVKTLSVVDYLEVLHMRRLLEAEAVAQATGKIPETTLRVILDVLEGLDESTVSSQTRWASDDLLHLTIAEYSNSGLMARTIADLRRKTRLFDFERIPSRFAPGRQEHIMIARALLEGDQTRAVAAMCLHIDNVQASILKNLNKLG